MVCLLHPEGRFSRYFEVRNTGPRESVPIWLSDDFNFDISNGAFPYDGKVMVLGNTVAGETARWNSDKVHENWLFACGGRLTRGLT